MRAATFRYVVNETYLQGVINVQRSIKRVIVTNPHSTSSLLYSLFFLASTIQLDQAGIDRFLIELTQESWDKHSVANGMSFPLRFETLEQEVNILSMIDILNTGHGFRKELHEDSDRGAFETIVFGIMSFHISSSPTNAEALSKITGWEVGEHFGITMQKDAPSELAHVTLSKPSVASKLAGQIQGVLNETGKILKKEKFETLGAFVIDAAKKANGSGETFSRILINTFPAFQDTTVIDGKSKYSLSSHF